MVAAAPSPASSGATDVRRTPFWIAALPLPGLLGVVACANVWGFSDLTEGGVDTGAQDATTPEAADEEADTGSDGLLPGDDSAAAPDVRAEDAASEAGEGGPSPREAGAGDGGNDGAAAAMCKSICSSGCCDAQGMCRTTLSAAYCGANGDPCQACGSCTLGACCTSSGTCGCTVLALCN